MKGLILAVAAISLIAAGCSTELGRTVPECEVGSATMVLAVQSVPTSDYVSCIVGLRAGWDYEDLQAQSGRSYYSLDSDRIGHGFIRVENVEACEVGDATLERTDDRGVGLWKDIDSEFDAKVTVIPEGPTPETANRAVGLIIELQGRQLKGRPIMMTPAVSEGSTASKIEAAAADGAHVIVISIRDVEEGTLTVLPKGSVDEVAAESLGEALDLFEDAESEPYYLGNWYYTFDGGCVTYSFDAEGPGVATIEEDIEAGLSLFDAEAFRQIARDAGYRLP